jgi:hypothetical protein
LKLETCEWPDSYSLVDQHHLLKNKDGIASKHKAFQRIPGGFLQKPAGWEFVGKIKTLKFGAKGLKEKLEIYIAKKFLHERFPPTTLMARTQFKLHIFKAFVLKLLN